MKTILLKFRGFQNALSGLFWKWMRLIVPDANKRSGPVHQDAAELDRMLSKPQPMPEVSRETHEGILRAARRAGMASMERPAYVYLHWKSQIVALAALALACGLWWGAQNGHNPFGGTKRMDPVLTAQLSATWSFIGGFGTNAPVLLSRPIEEQFNQLTNDLHKTTDILLASIP